jgi:tRNA-specific 2-thiouridylase
MRSPDNSQKTVVVGMSGGVDSSVAAALLLEQGYNVIGIFMKNWDEKDASGQCTAAKDYEDVIKVCDKLNIPYYSVEFVKEYWDNVFSQFLDEYKQGYTPNPDILCNREIKFKAFYDKAMELGADYLATGHYCQNKVVNGKHCLVKGLDQGKDQTYFLYAINGDVLDNVLFPIGHLQKSEVRKIAEQYDLSTKTKKDSTGICFIGERNFREFISGYIESQKGAFRHLDGTYVGEHLGCCFYTLGQRKGLGLGGPGKPWFVVGKDMITNTVFVERGGDHPALLCDDLTANEITWIQKDFNPTLPYKCKAKVRYRQHDQECVIESIENGVMTVCFSEPQRAVTPRQSIVFYDGEICLGGAMILEPGISHFHKN